jgi:hypothetical protein
MAAPKAPRLIHCACTRRLAPTERGGDIGVEKTEQYRPGSRCRQPRRLGFGVVASICLLAAGCSGGHHAAPASRPTPAPTRQADIPTPPPSATPGAPTATPGPSTQQLADLAAGKVLVQAQCAACHALADAGIAPAPSPVARPLDGIGGRHDRHWLEDELRAACAHVQPLRRGLACGQMHSVSVLLTSRQRSQVIAYLLSLR